MEMNEKDENVNGLDGTQATSESFTPSRVTGGQQPAPGRYPATAGAKGSKDLNDLVMKCYIKSNPRVSFKILSRRWLLLRRRRGIQRTHPLGSSEACCPEIFGKWDCLKMHFNGVLDQKTLIPKG